MRNNNILNNAYRDIYISEERKQVILDTILSEKRGKVHPTYKKMIAAVIIMCLMMISCRNILHVKG